MHIWLTKTLNNLKKLNFNQKIMYHFSTLLIDEACWFLHVLVSWVLRANGVILIPLIINTDGENVHIDLKRPEWPLMEKAKAEHFAALFWRTFHCSLYLSAVCRWLDALRNQPNIPPDPGGCYGRYFEVPPIANLVAPLTHIILYVIGWCARRFRFTENILDIVIASQTLKSTDFLFS